MKHCHWLMMSASLVVVVICCAIVWSESSKAVAQTSASKTKTKIGTSKTKSGDTKELDVRAEKHLEAFVIDTIKLAEEYEKAGKFEEAQTQLYIVGKLKPETPGLKEKIEQLGESVFETNDYDIDLDVADSWKKMVLVSKGKPVRVEAPGSYKLMLTAPVDAEGLPTKDPRVDMAAGVRCGALMGIVVALPDSATPTNSGAGAGKTSGRNNDKVGEPFEIGSSKEFTPKEDGMLLLNVNLPAGHKSTGKLKVHVSGHIKMLPKEIR